MPVQPAAPSLSRMVRDSGYIFSGTVMDVKRLSPASGAVAVVQITFRVDEAIHGVHSGEILVAREWAGLWDSGDRYRPGERVLLFLHRPSRLGLTSTVGGRLGRFEIDSSGQIVLEKARIAALASDPLAAPLIKGNGGLSKYNFASALRRARTE